MKIWLVKRKRHTKDWTINLYCTSTISQEYRFPTASRDHDQGYMHPSTYLLGFYILNADQGYKCSNSVHWSGSHASLYNQNLLARVLWDMQKMLETSFMKPAETPSLYLFLFVHLLLILSPLCMVKASPTVPKSWVQHQSRIIQSFLFLWNLENLHVCIYLFFSCSFHNTSEKTTFITPTKILEVNLSAFVYRQFHQAFSSIIRTNTVLYNT